MATRSITSSSKRRPVRAPLTDDVLRGFDGSMHECGCALPRPAFATMEEVCYAHELRLELRMRYLRRSVPATMLWAVGAD